MERKRKEGKENVTFKFTIRPVKKKEEKKEKKKKHRRCYFTLICDVRYHVLPWATWQWGAWG
jgi:hypothetical protein